LLGKDLIDLFRLSSCLVVPKVQTAHGRRCVFLCPLPESNKVFWGDNHFLSLPSDQFNAGFNIIGSSSIEDTNKLLHKYKKHLFFYLQTLELKDGTVFIRW